MKISIIVPIYNSEKHLHKCIDSILNQTYSNFELLLINDGSKDRSGEICDEYSLKDERIRVFHKENAGVSTARNIGIDNATGKYITFVDSDDWVGKTYLEDFFILENNPEAALVLQSILIENSNGEVKKKSLPDKVYHINEYSDLFYSIKLVWLWPYMASKLFAKDIIANNYIRFDQDITYGEDLLFMLDYILYTDQVFLLNKANYLYLHHENSASNSYHTYESEIKRLESVILKLNELDAEFNFDDKTNNHHKDFFARSLIRVMESLYSPSYKKTRSERKILLSKHNTSEMRSWFKNYFTSSTRFHFKIVQFLFSNQFLNLLDLYFLIFPMYLKLKKSLRRS